MKLSIVIPCFNEEETIKETHTRLCLVIKDLHFTCEIIYIDDGSKDSTWKLLQEFSLEKSSQEKGDILKILKFSRNFGQPAAVIAGLENSTGAVVAILDADLQDPPELIPAMYERTLQGIDVVYGQRQIRQQESYFKKITAWLFYRFFQALIGFEVPKDTGDFRLITRPVVNALLECKEHDFFLRGLVSWVGFTQEAFPYVRHGRFAGETKYTIKKMFAYAYMAIMSFSTKPLVFSMFFGCIGLGFSLGLAIWALLSWAAGQSVPGWASLFLTFLAGQSFVLGMLGVLGGYLGRVYTEVQGRPRYILQDTITKR